MAADCVRVHIESRCVGNVSSGVIRHNRDVISYLLVLRKTRLRIEGIAHGDVSRPGRASIRAPRIKQLRIDVVRSVSCVIPDSIKPSVGRNCKCAKPVPLVLRRGIIVDTMRCGEGLTPVGATHKHHIGRATPGR